MPTTLADGKAWLLADPGFRAGGGSVTEPDIDRFLDEFVDHTILKQRIPFSLIFQFARRLILANYQLTNEEISDLLSVSEGPRAQALAESVLSAVFGGQDSERTYTGWIRASLLANGLQAITIESKDLQNVLGILEATERTIPFFRFSDASTLATSRARLEGLV